MNIGNLLSLYNSFFQLNVYLQLALYAALAVALSYLLTPLIFWIFSFFSAKTKTDLDDVLFKLIKAPVSWSLSIILIYLAVFSVDIQANLQDILSRILLSILVLIWVRPASKASSFLLYKLSESKKGFVKPMTLPLFRNVALVIIWSLAIYFLFAVWGISLTAWLASAGIVGIAVGFAAKDTLANLISGIFILADAPYKIGDIIVLDSGEKGEVIHVGLRSTRIRTYDGTEITIPNAQMGNSKIVNETGTHIDKKVRIRIPVGISYDDDVEKAEKVMLKIASEIDEICEEPAPQVRFISFGASSLDLELRVWVPEPAKRGKVADILHRRILEEFRKENIEIPYSKMDIYIKEHASS